MLISANLLLSGVLLVQVHIAFDPKDDIGQPTEIEASAGMDDLADSMIQPEDTPIYRIWRRRADDNERRYTASYLRDRRELEERILRGDILEFMVEDYVLQLQVLGDEARIVELCCRMSSAGRQCGEARKRLFKMAKGDLLDAKQYKEVLRVAGDVQSGYDKLIEKYNGNPERDRNWCELRYKGDCASEFHDAFAYFEALAGTDRRMDAVILSEKLIRTRIDPSDLMAQSRYTIWKLPSDISTAGVISQLIVCADRAGDATLHDALDTLAKGKQTEADLDAFREDVLGAQAVEAKRRAATSVFADSEATRSLDKWLERRDRGDAGNRVP